MMGIALGGLGVLSLRVPRDVNLYHLVDLPTLLLALFLVAVLVLIAYFTNPSEASFRAFLTELAFRHHLSRLSEAQDADLDDDDDDTRLARPIDYKGPRKKAAAPGSPPTHDSPVVFHFANKASVSLRTPGYRFRSFAVLTFAVVSPTEINGQPPSAPAQPGAWFVGAFGHWWLAFHIRMLPRPVRVSVQAHDASPAPASDTTPPRPTDDRREREHHAPAKPPPRPQAHRAPPRTKAALRERLSLHTSPGAAPNGPSRPTTPPPLPKSALLPLHGPPPAPPLLSPPPAPAPAPSPAPTPALTDVLAQLDAARAATAELRAQLASPAPAHATLHAAVEAARETKKREDAGRAAVKARTKALEDARRQADAGKRDAEKHLKAATAARDGAARRIERLERDIDTLRTRMADDAVRVETSRVDSQEERVHLEDALGARRAEVAVAEDAVGTLAARARDLEGAVAAEVARLEALKNAPAASTAWPPRLVSPRPPALALGALSNHVDAPDTQFSPFAPNTDGTGAAETQFSPFVGAAADAPDTPFSPFADGTGAADTQFSPFAESPVAAHGPLSPVSAALLPSSLVQSMESPREAFFAREQARAAAHAEVHAPPPADSVPRSAPFLPTPDDRWLGAAAAHHTAKGLNPAAKVFTLSRARTRLDSPSPPAGSPFFHDAAPAVPAVPASPVPAPPPAPTFFSALHSAFAPSPAEREALQRSSAGALVPSARAWDEPQHRAAFFNPWPAKE